MVPYRRTGETQLPHHNERLVLEMVTSVINSGQPQQPFYTHPSSNMDQLVSGETQYANKDHLTWHTDLALGDHFRQYQKANTKQRTEQIYQSIKNSSNKSMAELEIDYKENFIRLNGLQNDILNSVFEHSLFARKEAGSKPIKSASIGELLFAIANVDASMLGSQFTTESTSNEIPTFASNDTFANNENAYYYGIAETNDFALNLANDIHTPEMYNLFENIQPRGLKDINEDNIIFGIRNCARKRSPIGHLQPTIQPHPAGNGSMQPHADVGSDSYKQFCTFCKRNNEPPLVNFCIGLFLH